MSNLAEETQDNNEENGKKKRGSPLLYKGMPSLNPAGRPKKVLEKEKRTNREIRQSSLLEVARKLKPHISKSIMAAVAILDNKEASETNKLKAAAFMVTTYRDLLKDIYDLKYSEDEGEEVQEKGGAVLSLRVINTEDNE